MSWGVTDRMDECMVDYHKSGLGNFGGFRDDHAKQNKPTAPNKIMGNKYSQLMSPPTSTENPPTLPDHHPPLITGRELANRITKNDKVEMENSTIPSWRRLILIKRMRSNVENLNHRRPVTEARTAPMAAGSGGWFRSQVQGHKL
jgi:hypothetical protein